MYKTLIFLLVLYAYENWSRTLRTGSENRVLRRIFGPKGEEVTVDWRKLRNEVHRNYNL
jgi:hypothetical protein